MGELFHQLNDNGSGLSARAFDHHWRELCWFGPDVRFGSEVTIMEMGLRLIQREDEDVSEAAKTILENESINIRLSAEYVALEKYVQHQSSVSSSSSLKHPLNK